MSPSYHALDLVARNLMLINSIVPVGNQEFCVDAEKLKKGKKDEEDEGVITYRIYFGYRREAQPNARDGYVLLVDCYSDKWEGYEIFYRRVLIHEDRSQKGTPRVLALHVNSIAVPRDALEVCSAQSFSDSYQAGVINLKGFFQKPKWYGKCGCFVPLAQEVTGCSDALDKVRKIIKHANNLPGPEDLRNIHCRCKTKPGEACLDNCGPCKAFKSWALIRFESSGWVMSMKPELKIKYKAVMCPELNTLVRIREMTGVARSWKRYHVCYGPQNPFKIATSNTSFSNKDNYIPYLIKAVPDGCLIHVFLTSGEIDSRWVCRLIIRSETFSIYLYRSDDVQNGRFDSFYSAHFTLIFPSLAHQALGKKPPSRKPNSSPRTGPRPELYGREYSVSSLTSSRSSSKKSDEHTPINSIQSGKSEAASASFRPDSSAPSSPSSSCPSPASKSATRSQPIKTGIDPHYVSRDSPMVHNRLSLKEFTLGHAELLYIFEAHCYYLEGASGYGRLSEIIFAIHELDNKHRGGSRFA